MRKSNDKLSEMLRTCLVGEGKNFGCPDVL